jgi:class 3 adenylate cyclase
MAEATSPPRTRYAKNAAGISIAYQVLGEGPFDMVLVPGFVSNIEAYWQMPVVPEILNRLASFSRLILFDKAGTGLSDPVMAPQTLEERMDDVRAVMDAAGSEEAALFGISEGGPMSLLFAATYPDRTRALVLYGTTPRFMAAPGWEWGWKPDEMVGDFERMERDWGEGALLEKFAPSAVGNEMARQAWGRFQRAGASPGMARAVLQAITEIDARDILPAITVPTLIVHRTGEKVAPVEGARYMAEHIPRARLVEFPSQDHLIFVGDAHPIMDEVEEFLTGTRHTHEPDRVLATVLFTDIVDSTRRAAEMGDRAWRELLGQHDALVRRAIDRHRGLEIKTMGDGFLATFDGPARAIQCACSARTGVLPLGVEIRAGLHTGEVELINGDVGGIAVNIGARVGAAAGPGEVLVSRTVTDLVAGSGLAFESRGPHSLKGVPGEWELYAVAA